MRIQPQLVRYAALNAPMVIFLAVTLVVPLAGIIAASLDGSPYILSNFGAIVGSRTYLRVVGASAFLGLMASGVATALAFLFSIWVLRLRGRWKQLVIACVVAPFFISYLLRALSWIPVLGFNGLINRSLLALGWIDAPIPLIYNSFAVVLGTANALFPVAALPLLAAVHNVDGRLLQAAHSLGADRVVVFRRIFLPLVAPSVVSTFIIVFAIATGFYITPSVLGGGKVLLAPNLIELLILRRGEWGTGSALAVILLLIFVTAVLLARWLGRARAKRVRR